MKDPGAPFPSDISCKQYRVQDYSRGVQKDCQFKINPTLLTTNISVVKESQMKMTANSGCSNIKRQNKRGDSASKDSCYSLKRYYNKHEYIEKTNDKVTHTVAQNTNQKNEVEKI